MACAWLTCINGGGSLSWSKTVRRFLEALGGGADRIRVVARTYRWRDDTIVLPDETYHLFIEQKARPSLGAPSIDNRSETALVAMRQILRGAELSGKALAREAGLTASQIIVLQELVRRREAMAGELARAARLSQPTVTALIDKLAARGFVVRRRDESDRRRVWVEITSEGRAALTAAPDTMQAVFVKRFETLPGWEQAMLVAALERVASLIDAEDLDAAPILDVGAIDKEAPR